MNGKSGGLTLGILGGGQLARMTALAAYAMGIKIAIVESMAGSPAGMLATTEILGDWADPAVTARLAAVADVVTLESEFVPPAVMERIAAAGTPVLPTVATIRAVRDKLQQKERLNAHHLPTTAFAAVESPVALERFGAAHGWPVVLKARRLGYDGRGNVTVRSVGEAAVAFSQLSRPAEPGEAGDLFAEAWAPFTRELAVMAVRDAAGAVATYPVVETVQRDHICHEVSAPAALSEPQARRARDLAAAAAEAIGHVGVLGVEMFELPDGRILINELAPRPHNSGHYTIEACVTSQFENHVRAVCGLPLGATTLRRRAAMVNLLGDRAGDVAPRGLDRALDLPDVHVHLYGKVATRPGRKLGHVTALASDTDEALNLARRAASAIQL